MSNVGNFGDSADEQLKRRLQSVPLPNFMQQAALDERQRLVERITDLEAENVGLLLALKAIVNGDARKTKKNEKCEHGLYGYEDCEECYCAFAAAAIAERSADHIKPLEPSAAVKPTEQLGLALLALAKDSGAPHGTWLKFQTWFKVADTGATLESMALTIGGKP